MNSIDLKEKNNTTIVSRQERVKIVNDIINEISSRGRKFFNQQGKVAQIVDKGRIYYKTEYGDKELLCLSVPDYRAPKGWFHGGTLLALVKEFRDYVKDGKSREYSMLHSPHWGYPEDDMVAIRTLAVKLGFLTEYKK